METWIGLILIDYDITGGAAALRLRIRSSGTARNDIWYKMDSVMAVIVLAILGLVIGYLLVNAFGNAGHEITKD